MHSDIQKFFSKCRLDKYRMDGETEDQAFVRYQWNIKLAEALLPSLNYFEIGLRNGVDRAIRELHGDCWLLDIPDALRLRDEDIRQIEKFKVIVSEKQGWGAKQDDIVAMLGFGFWSSLFQRRYDPLLWQKAKSLEIVFPHMQRALRTRKYIEPKLNLVRKLRNRIAHHEPVFHVTPDIQAIHQICLELVYGMSRTVAQELTQIDRFTLVYSEGLCLISR